MQWRNQLRQQSHSSKSVRSINDQQLLGKFGANLVPSAYLGGGAKNNSTGKRPSETFA